MADRLARAAPLLVPVLLAVVLFAPATLGGKVLSAGDLPLYAPPFDPQAAPAEPQNELQFDSAYVFEPDGLEVREALREGRLPLWTRHQSAGRPLLAAQQSAPLYPLTWLGVAFPYFEAQVWIAVLKLALAALGAALLGRALGLGRGAALLAGVSFGFGTYLTDWLLHPHSNAYVFLPFLLLAAERLCRSGSVRAAAALAGLLGLALLSGQPESAFIAGVPTAAWVAWRAGSVRAAAIGAGAAVLALGVGAVMVIPFVEALGQSFDASRSQDALPGRSVLSVFFPDYWGRPDRLEIRGPSNFTERTLYVGVLPLLLAGAGLLVRRPRGAQLFFALMTAVSLLLALDTGPVASVVRGLPGLDAMNLNRLLVLASLGLAMLAGFGLQLLLDGDRFERRRMLIAAAVLAVLPALAVLVAHPSWLGDLQLGANRLLGRDNANLGVSLPLASVLRWSLVGAVGLVLIALTALRPGRPVAFSALAVGLVAADLLVVAWGFNPLIPKDQAEPAAPPPVGALSRLSTDGRRMVGVGGMTPNTASRWGLEDARGHEQPRVERTSRLWRALGGGLGDGTEAVDAADPGTPRLLDQFGVGAVLTNRLAAAAPEVRKRLGDGVALSGAGGVVIARDDPLPRAFVAYRWRTAPGLEGSLAAVRSAPRDQPVIEGGGPSPSRGPRPVTPARVVENSDTEVRVAVSARAAGRLVLLDTFYPGWKAEVNGRETEIRPANAAFRAVAVPAGRSEVRFRYRPASAVVGGVVSVVSLLVLVALTVLGYRRRRWSRQH